MANQAASRLSGDDYQHLYSWQQILQLKMPRRGIHLVTLEAAWAGSVDDVVIHPLPNVGIPSRFYQIKYHVDQRSEYSIDVLLEKKNGGKSLWQKFWETWRLLRAQDSRNLIELYLLSNWTWGSADKFKDFIGDKNNSVNTDFLFAPPNSEAGQIRQRLQSAVQANDDDEFLQFLGSLRFRLGFDCREELEERVIERMEWLGLRADASALLVAVGIVRQWIESQTKEITLERLENAINAYSLRRPEEIQRAITVHLTTIKGQKFEIEPDFAIDWRPYFQGSDLKKGHQLINPADWNQRLLPELQRLEAQINEEQDIRFVKARGLARLSAWFAFGYTFSEVARYVIEIDQTGKLWRSDAIPSQDFRVVSSGSSIFPEGEVLDGEGEVVALGISVTGLIDDDVRSYLASRPEKVASLLLLRPERELGREALSSAGDVVALADQVKERARTFVKKWRAKKLLLFYFGPLSGACLIGHRLNAVCEFIQIMEDQQPGYEPSFLLS